MPGVLSRIGGLAAALLAVAAAAPAGAADLVQLKDGRIVEGVKVTRAEGALVLHYRNGDVRVPLDMVQDWSIEGAPPPEPATDEEREKKAQGLVPWRGKWIPVAAREKEIRKEAEARQKAIEEFRRHREWKDRYAFRTRNFEFESTQPPAQNTEYSELLEAYFREFSRTWKVSVPQKWGRLKVCFYGSEADFLRTAGAGRGTLAYYRFVEPRELDFYYDRNDPSESVACLFHEANHYLTDLMDERFQYPHWVNEAMAEYYGASIWDPATKTMKVGGVQQGRLAELKADLSDGKPFPLRDLLADMSDDYRHYYWGWSFVHFMMETPRHRPRFMRFFADLATARDVARVQHPSFPEFTVVRGGEEIRKAFLARFGLKESDLPALEKEWMDHVQGLDASGLRGLEEGGVRAAAKGMWKFRAPRLLKAAVDGGSRRAIVWTTYASCLMAKGDEVSRAEALAIAARATEVLPMESSTWACRGYLVHAAGDEDAGRRFVELAREMDPEAGYFDPEARERIGSVTGSGE